MSIHNSQQASTQHAEDLVCCTHFRCTFPCENNAHPWSGTTWSDRQSEGTVWVPYALSIVSTQTFTSQTPPPPLLILPWVQGVWCAECVVSEWCTAQCLVCNVRVHNAMPAGRNFDAPPYIFGSLALNDALICRLCQFTVHALVTTTGGVISVILSAFTVILAKGVTRNGKWWRVGQHLCAVYGLHFHAGLPF